jgi:hypothetical protein
MAELKTKKNHASVKGFLEGTPDERKRADCYALLDLMREVTGDEPSMWGDSIVGYGSYRYKHRSGQSGEWFLTGFSPRKRNLTIYIMPGFDRYGDIMAKLGKYKNSVSCLYVNKLADIDLDALRELVKSSYVDMKEANAAGGC